MKSHRFPCSDEACTFCESRAESRANDQGDSQDWRRGQDTYERYLDTLGGSR